MPNSLAPQETKTSERRGRQPVDSIVAEKACATCMYVIIITHSSGTSKLKLTLTKAAVAVEGSMAPVVQASL